jgi:hypothetical protein
MKVVHVFLPPFPRSSNAAFIMKEVMPSAWSSNPQVGACACGGLTDLMGCLPAMGKGLNRALKEMF